MGKRNWAPFALVRVFDNWQTGVFRDLKHPKGVIHRTMGNDGGLFQWYQKQGGIPHFTIGNGIGAGRPDGEITQHYSLDRFSRALRNKRGGVETNSDGAIQIEIVGLVESTPAQLLSLAELCAWLTSEGHIVPEFPMGRLSKPYQRATNDEWDNGVGWFAHGNIPEQDHGDPDLTDAEWAVVCTAVGGTPLPALVDVRLQQQVLWDAGFAKRPHTLGYYTTAESWVDGIAGPETKRAWDAYSASKAEEPEAVEVATPVVASHEKIEEEFDILNLLMQKKVAELTYECNQLITNAKLNLQRMLK